MPLLAFICVCLDFYFIHLFLFYFLALDFPLNNLFSIIFLIIITYFLYMVSL
jgi:hypothetical protein